MNAPGVDTVVDPTANVIALVESNSKAAAMLREADIKYNDAVARHLTEIGALRSDHAKETRAYDSDRYDKIRSVDMANAAATATQILQAVNTNAGNQERTAQTLRDQVAATAAAAENRQVAFAADMVKRLSAVELSMSEGKGKQTVADPQQEKLTSLVELIARNQATGSGKSEGASDTVKLGALLVVMFLGLIGIGTFFFVTQRSSTVAPAPQIIYVTAPAAGVPLPSTPQNGVRP